MKTIRSWMDEKGLTGIELLIAVAVGATVITMFSMMLGAEIAK